MINPFSTFAAACIRRARRALRPLPIFILSFALIATVGCGIGKAGKKKDDFFTSGSREADQRASQRMAKTKQLDGSEFKDNGKADGLLADASGEVVILRRG